MNMNGLNNWLDYMDSLNEEVWAEMEAEAMQAMRDDFLSHEQAQKDGRSLGRLW